MVGELASQDLKVIAPSFSQALIWSRQDVLGETPAWSRVMVLHTVSSSGGCQFLTHNRLQVSLGAVARRKDPEDDQLPEGLK